jgi:thiopurine S-methyltransferase
MHREFWQQRWQEGTIGFHEGKPNEQLLSHASHLHLEGARVLVPLCGKTVDLAWLAAQGAEVVGIELVTSAVEAFFHEQGLTPERTQAGALERFHVPDLTVFAGDFFALDAETAGGAFDACWDRAALVALPEGLRERYVAHARSLLRPGATTLLVTFEHDVGSSEPPFSIPDALVRTLFVEDAITELATHDVSSITPNLIARGGTFVRQHVYRIERR